MGLAEELYCAMLEVGYAARRHKVPHLSDAMIDNARKCLPIWREDERSLVKFSRDMLRMPTYLRAATGQLPYAVASSCWRLIDLLEYISQETEL